MNTVVSVVIPHFSGDVLSSCLDRLFERTEGSITVIVVDDSIVSDGSIEAARDRHQAITVLKTTGGQGFGASCNIGLKHVKTPYAILLNNDIEVTAGWLRPLVQTMEADPQIAFCQPKILSLKDPTRFDRGGGAGGLMDVFGYPFALGSLVHHVEVDEGQYDEPRDLFWAHGSTMMVRMSALNEIGFFDEEFQMQAEEIDLCCRALARGFRIRSAPASSVCHYFGWTLKTDSLRRHYMSHRNTIVVLLKNWPLRRLMWVFPVRLLLEFGTIVYGIVWKREWKQHLGIAMALVWIITHPLSIAVRRMKTSALTNDSRLLFRRTYKGSIIWAFFIRGVKTSRSLSKKWGHAGG